MHVFNSNSGQLSLHLPRKLLVDNFAGGGGASLAMEMAFGRPVDIAINHNEKAIGTHKLNHPDTKHYIESVWDVDPVEVTNGAPVECAWFSPDCTHHSKARGGKPKEKSIRGLAWVAVRWMLEVRPEIVPIENVEEFVSWGPLDDAGQPIKERAGETFAAFVGIITNGLACDHPGFLECLEFLGVEPGSKKAAKLSGGLGYTVDYRELKACDYGAPTTRKRFFMVARCDGLPITWPTPTHGSCGQLQPYRAAAECIDWQIPMKSIFGRKRPLAEATLKRIARGLEKFVFNNPKPFVVDGRSVAPFITECANASNQRNMAIDEPLRTVTAQTKGGTFALVAPIIDRQFGTSRGNSITNPAGTIMADGGGKSALVAAFLAKHYGGNYTGAGIALTDPLHTITTTDHHALVAAFLIKYYSEGGQWQGLSEPMHTIPTKDRLGLVVVKGEPYRIVDIGMRMLSPGELFQAQGFPLGYVHDRYLNKAGKLQKLTKADQVRLVGNSVSPPNAAALLKANLNATNEAAA